MNLSPTLFFCGQLIFQPLINDLAVIIKDDRYLAAVAVIAVSVGRVKLLDFLSGANTSLAGSVP
jgi:hypothetical protein